MTVDRYVSMAAILLKVPAEPLQAVANVESGRRYYNESGKVVIRFEPHIFWQLWGRSNRDKYQSRFKGQDTWQGLDDQYKTDREGWRGIHESQVTEWDAFTIAIRYDEEAAHKSISMGAFQIMGFNAARIGYESADQMLASFHAAPLNQVIGFCLFIETHALSDAIRREDFLTFARVYNGSGQAQRYADLMTRQVELIRQGSNQAP